MTYVFDIDGTVCTNTNGKNDYLDAEPFLERIEKINKLYDEGNIIIFQTARGMGRNSLDARKSNNQFYKFTYDQLIGWGVKFHDLFLGKPNGDFFIDDRAISDKDFFHE